MGHLRYANEQGKLGGKVFWHSGKDYIYVCMYVFRRYKLHFCTVPAFHYSRQGKGPQIYQFHIDVPMALTLFSFIQGHSKKKKKTVGHQDKHSEDLILKILNKFFGCPVYHKPFSFTNLLPNGVKKLAF